jgi:hypothetical protein
MKIVSNDHTTLVSFNEDYTEAVLSRAQGIVYNVYIPAKYFSMQKLEQFCNLDDDSFIGLAKIQKLRKELKSEDR